MPHKIVFNGDLPDELWKQVNDFPDYEISNLGRVKSKTRKVKMPNTGFMQIPDVVMSPGKSNGGYLYVNLVSRGGKKKTITVHRLVALHFVDNPHPDKFRIIRHIDNNKQNNKACNLDWCNHSINNKQAYDDGIKNASHLKRRGSASWSAKPVDQFTKEGLFIKRHAARVEAESETGIPSGQINRVASGAQKTAGGFIWRAVS